MYNIKKKIKMLIFIILILILTSSISAYATYKYLAMDINYIKDDGTEINVEEALNELYTNINNNIQYDILDKSNKINTTYTYSIKSSDLSYKKYL